jgi:hypothetical protein
VPDANVIDDRAFPVTLMPEDEEAKMELANEWAEKRRLAEGVGGQFEVRHRATNPEAPPPPAPPPAPSPPAQMGSPRPPLRGPGARVFGRKGL